VEQLSGIQTKDLVTQSVADSLQQVCHSHLNFPALSAV
jgi:hypothetical protein